MNNLESLKFNFFNLSTIDLKILLLVLKKIEEKKFQTNTIIIDDQTFKDILGINAFFDNKKLFIKNTLNNICKQTFFSNINCEEIEVISYFTSAQVLWNKKQIVFELNSKFVTFFQNLKIATNLDLDKLSRLKSKYSIIIYKKIKSIWQQGKFEITNVDAFKTKLGLIDKSNSYLVSRVLKIVQKDLSNVLGKDFKIHLIKKGEGGKTNKLLSIVFVWKTLA